MPSKLPIIKANTTQENINKMKVIANANKRSVAKELEWLIENHIQNYEEINGEINYEEFVNQQLKEISAPWNESLYKKILKIAKDQDTTPREIWNKQLARMSDKKKSDKDFQMTQEYIEKRIAQDEE